MMLKLLLLCSLIVVSVSTGTAGAAITPFTQVTGTIDPFTNVSRAVDIVYLNGIDNTQVDAISSLTRLSSRYRTEGGKRQNSDVRFSYIYNPTGGEVDDNIELESMGDITTAARAYADRRLASVSKSRNYDDATKSRLWNAFYRARLRKLYSDDMIHAYKENAASKPAIGSVIQKIFNSLSEKILAGHKVVVVSHSQGNLFAEATHAYMVQNMTPAQLKAIRFVGVASVASTIPNDGYYTSFNQDEAISAYETLYGSARARNFDGVRMYNNQPVEMSNSIGWDETCHNFIDYYMDTSIIRRGDSDRTAPYENSVVRKIVSDIDNSLDQCTPTTAEINLSFLTATLTWLNAGTDIDLWMYEPGSDESTKIYYNNKIGKTGYLDLDDIDGYGPEHIYVENRIPDLSGTYFIYGHAYRALSDEVATIGVNFSNSVVYTRTFDLSQSQAQCAFKLVLSKHDSVYDYTLSACE